MSSRALSWLGAFLVLVGILPFLSVGIATVIGWLSGCVAGGDALDAAACPYAGTAMERTLAGMMLAGVWVVFSVPLGLIGAACLLIVQLRNRRGPE